MTGVRFLADIFLLITLRSAPEHTQPSSLSVYICIVSLLRLLSLNIRQRHGVKEERHGSPQSGELVPEEVRTCGIRSRNTNHSSVMFTFISRSFYTRERMHSFALFLYFDSGYMLRARVTHPVYWITCFLLAGGRITADVTLRSQQETRISLIFKRSILVAEDGRDPLVVPTLDLRFGRRKERECTRGNFVSARTDNIRCYSAQITIFTNIWDMTE
jgi:hypothetical protein